MKLAKIWHERCAEFDASTLVWIPDEWSEEDFRDVVRRAQAEYNDTAAQQVAPKPPNDYRPYDRIPYESFPDRKIGEVLAEWTEKKQVWEAWNKKKEHAEHPFGWYLVKLGCTAFWDYEPEITVVCDWGHAHGTIIAYEQTTVKDLPGPANRKI